MYHRTWQPSSLRDLPDLLMPYICTVFVENSQAASAFPGGVGLHVITQTAMLNWRFAIYIKLDLMRSFLFEHRKLVALLVVIALWLSLFPIWVRWVTTRPLDELIAMAPRGAISKEIRVVIPENYDLNLVFERANIPFEQLKTLLGDWTYKDGKPIPSGVRVPIRWVLKEVPKGSIVASGEIDSFGSTAWSAAEVDRRVGRIRAVPGRYLFTAEILHDVPELAHIKTRLSMQLRSKTSSTWQITVVWWGSIINFFFVWPAAIIITLALLWRAGLTFRSKGRAAGGSPMS